MRRTFDELWNQFSKQVSDGNSYADIIPSTKEILSLVFRLPKDVAQLLNSVSVSISEEYHEIYIYPEQTIHTTVLFLSYYVSSEIADFYDIQVLYEVIQSAFNKPITGTVNGLGLFPTTVFAQLYLNGMEELRRDISRKLKNIGYYDDKTRAYEEKLDWSLTYANIARFMQTVQPGIVKKIAQYRDMEFGEITLSHLELVKTNKFLSEGGTKIYGSFSV